LDHEKLAEIQQSLPEEMIVFFERIVSMLQDSLSFALSGVFMTAAIIMIFAVFLTLFLKEIPLRSSSDALPDTQQNQHNKEKLTKQPV
jgi:preprotein translocase subunit SecY